MLNKDGKLNNQKGSVAIEATLALTAFFFLFLMIYSLITICRAQARIQVAIDTTAKEISQYSYIYGRTGLDQSLGDFQRSTQETKTQVNEIAGQVADVFNSMQIIGTTSKESIDAVGKQDFLEAADKVGDLAETIKGSADDIKSIATTLKDAAKDPKKLIVSLGALAASEGLELAKSRLIAEPICKGLVEKHLKRSENDNANDFCRAMGIVPGTYLADTSYYNGLDFSNSTLFAYGADDIFVSVTYEIKMLQLLPVDVKFKITQTAKTRGWLRGDKTKIPDSIDLTVKMLEKGETVWNDMDGSERASLIRKMGIESEMAQNTSAKKIKKDTYLNLYDTSSETFIRFESYNPLADKKDLNNVSKEEIKERLKKYAAWMNSSTDNISTVIIEDEDENGNKSRRELTVGAGYKKKVIVTIPEDEGLKNIFIEAAAELGGNVDFEFNASYGKVFKADNSEVNKT